MNNERQTPADVISDAVMRRVEARKALCETAIKAAAKMAEDSGTVPAWFPQLAPLTRAERAIVLKTIMTALSGS